MMNLIDGRGSHVRNLHDVLRKSTGPQRLGGKWPTFIPEADEAEQEGPHEPISQGLHEGDPGCKYFISVSKNCGYRRLRLNGHCYVKAYKCSSVIYTNQVNAEQIDSICRDCKRRMRQQAGEDEAVDSSSSSGTSSARSD